MKTIVCFGDSNTWGSDPVTDTRFPFDVRWPGVLRRLLGDGYWVIEEGLPGRTTVWDDPIEGFKNGRDYMIPCLKSHMPIDLITIMLGSNDLKKRFSLSAFDVAEGAGVLVEIVQRSDAGPEGKPPKLLLIAPPPLAALPGTRLADMFEGAQEKSLKLAEQFRRVAQERGCELLNAGDVITSSPIDAIHLEADQHRRLAEAVAEQVKSMLV